MSDESKDLERRKVFRELIPYVATLYSSFTTASAPPEPQKEEQKASEPPPVRIHGLDTVVIAPGVFSVRLTPHQVMGYVRKSMIKRFESEGAREEKFARKGTTQLFLTLPSRVVSVRFIPALTENDARSLLDEARVGSQDTWIFTTSIGVEKDLPLAPTSSPADQGLVNRFRIIPLTKLLPEIFKSWHVIATGQEGDLTRVVLQDKPPASRGRTHSVRPPS